MFPQYQLVQIISRDAATLSDLEDQLKQASGENEREEDTDTKQQLELTFDIWSFLFLLDSHSLLGVRVSLL